MASLQGEKEKKTFKKSRAKYVMEIDKLKCFNLTHWDYESCHRNAVTKDLFQHCTSIHSTIFDNTNIFR